MTSLVSLLSRSRKRPGFGDAPVPTKKQKNALKSRSRILPETFDDSNFPPSDELFMLAGPASESFDDSNFPSADELFMLAGPASESFDDSNFPSADELFTLADPASETFDDLTFPPDEHFMLVGGF
ncbi:hypothetical protein CRV24_006360 [Beauveria bassiana]|nr:hypothetical protein CRV24_006360 [Beauveria bassiana]